MSSNSLQKWDGESRATLDEIEDAHQSVGGSERGRRYATQQINHAYAVLLSSHFQRYCRDLHSECIDFIVAIVPAALQEPLRFEFLFNRFLDRGNPHPGAIGADFKRLGVDFWPEVYALDTRNQRRRVLLQELVDWRNAIAHQDFTPIGGDPTLHLARVQAWRSGVSALARNFDRAAQEYLSGLNGVPPW